MLKVSKHILPIIVLAQFFCTSLWFAGNAVLPDLAIHLQLTPNALGNITSAVQFGFITGTLLFTVLIIADRFAPSAVFFYSSVLASLCNICMLINGIGLEGILVMRFCTGFFLAGIYPVGMKIASDYFEKGLGKALGFLVGALVLGTALPHLIKSFTATLPWKSVLYFTSGLALTGGTLMLLLVPLGPFQKKMLLFNYRAIGGAFKNASFRKAAFGYFGHMWELYTFWAFIPFILHAYQQFHPQVSLPVSSLSFLIIACGGLACFASGYLASIFGTEKTAFSALFLSAGCCLLSPLAFSLPYIPFILFLIFWGLVVIADSPLFSSLVALHANVQLKGTALTLVTCIGFSITIASIELLSYLSQNINPKFLFMLLAVGPIAGLCYKFTVNKK